MPWYVGGGVPYSLSFYASEQIHDCHRSTQPGGNGDPGGRISYPPPYILGVEVGYQWFIQQVYDKSHQDISSQTFAPGGEEKQKESDEKNSLFPTEKKNGHVSIPLNSGTSLPRHKTITARGKSSRLFCSLFFRKQELLALRIRHNSCPPSSLRTYNAKAKRATCHSCLKKAHALEIITVRKCYQLMSSILTKIRRKNKI